MVLKVLRPMTIAAAASLVAGSTFSSHVTVYADESNEEEEQSGFDHDHRASLHNHHDEIPHTSTTSSSSSSSRTYSNDKSDSPSRREYKRTHFVDQRPVISQEEDLMPGLVYVAIAGVTGSLLTRQKGIFAKVLTPAAFASVAGAYFMPHRTQNLLGLGNDKSWSSTSSFPSSETLKLSELVSKSREAWHTAEVKTDSATEESRQWWNKNISKAEDKVTEQIGDAKAWVDSKTREADKVLDNVSTQATEAIKTVKQWVDDSKPSHVINLAYDSEPYRPLSSQHKDHWWSSRSSGSSESAFIGVSDSPDHWSNGEEQGTAKVREDDGAFWLSRNRHHYQTGVLDNKDVDKWSSTNEEMGTALIDERQPSDVSSHRSRIFSDGHEYVRRPHDPEYWSNGQEISSASIRDARYYDWPGGVGPSLSRTSWWDRRGLSGFTSTISTSADESEVDSGLAALKTRAELIARDAKDAADKTARDIASRLAYEQDILSKKSADARAHAEATLKKIKAQGEALLRERNLTVEKNTKEVESRLKLEIDAATRAAADAKSKALAWEREQQERSNKTIREISDKVAHDKAAAERTAAELRAKAEKTAMELKAKADAWAREQREKAEKATKEIHDRVLRDTAAAEKAAAAAKAALDAKMREEKLRLERTVKDFDERIRAQKLKEEKVAADLDAQVGSFARLHKEKVDQATKELEEAIAYENKQKHAREAKILAETAVLESRRIEERVLHIQAEKAAADARARLEHAAAEQRRMEEQARIKSEAAAAERATKEMADRAAFEHAEVAAREAKARVEATAREKQRHAELAAKEMQHMRAIEVAEAEARDTKARAETMLLEKKLAGERALKDMEGRLRAERTEAAARETKAHADALEAEQKLSAQRAAYQLEEKNVREQAAEIARGARARADALLSEKKMSADLVAKELEQKLSLEKAEADALAAKTRAESLLAEAKLAAERGARQGATSTGSGWSWPWSSSTSSTSTTSTSTKHTHNHEGFDTTGHLMEHIAEDIRQTKEDFQDGLSHLKEAVLGAENKAASAAEKNRETVREAVNSATPERGRWWSSGSSTVEGIEKGAVNLGRNVEATAVKVEKDVEKRAATVGKDMDETARKAYDNVIDAATTLAGQTAHSHHYHEHDHARPGDSHTLMDHIAEDLRHTKDDIQSGVDNLKDAVFGAEKAANEAANDMLAKVEEAEQEGRRWWNAKTREAEKTASRLDSELKAGLDRAGSKIRELERGIDENLGVSGREADDDSYWFRAEENRQQQQRRGGRGM